MMDTQGFIQEYLSWLKLNMAVEDIGNGVIEITSPFLDRYNDYIQIYVIPNKNGGYLLSDDGYTISNLLMSGMDFNTQKRKSELEVILNGFGVKKDERDALTVNCSVTNYPIKKHSLMQSILAVNDLFVLSRPNIISLFLQDVETFLMNNHIRFTSDIEIKGKSGFSHKYDFIVPKSSKSPERLIKVVNNINRSYTESMIFSWNDTRQLRSADTKLFAIINDVEKDIPANCLEALDEYGIDAKLWTKRSAYTRDLAS